LLLCVCRGIYYAKTMVVGKKLKVRCRVKKMKKRERKKEKMG